MDSVSDCSGSLFAVGSAQRVTFEAGAEKRYAFSAEEAKSYKRKERPA